MYIAVVYFFIGLGGPPIIGPGLIAIGPIGPIGGPIIGPIGGLIPTAKRISFKLALQILSRINYRELEVFVNN